MDSPKKHKVYSILLTVVLIILADIFIPIGIFSTTNCNFDKNVRRNLINGLVPDDIPMKNRSFVKGGECTPRTYYFYII